MVDYEHYLVEFIAWMRGKDESLGGKPHLDYLVLPFQFFSVYSVDRHEYWACDCFLEMRMGTNCRLTKTYVARQNAEVFELPHCDRLRM